ncbi:MAG: hypothetical protein ACJZ00_07855 [Cytophagales bacterium]|nr:MAG: hypothetical protein CND58_03875 [Rhodothermaeota bacterium MED-G16]
MNSKQKVSILLIIDTTLFVVLLYLLFKGLWFEAMIPFLLSLGINFWNFNTYKEYFSRKEK